MAGKAAFIDTNILVYAVSSDSPFHSLAKKILEQKLKNEYELWISPQVIREYLVVMSRSEILMQRQTMKEVIRDFKKVSGLFSIANDTTNGTEKLYELIEKYDVKGKNIHDANVVATMLVNSIQEIITQNVKDFRRFEPEISIISLD